MKKHPGHQVKVYKSPKSGQTFVNHKKAGGGTTTVVYTPGKPHGNPKTLP